MKGLRHIFGAIVLALAVVPLGACATTDLPTLPPGEAATLAAIGTETAAAARCPGNVLEVVVLLSARQLFDATQAPKLSDDQLRRVDQARATTDVACGLVEVPAPPI